jgi:NAD+ synthase
MRKLHPWLVFNPEYEVERITKAIRSSLRDQLKRRGAVLGLSGGIDSSVCLALLAGAIGPQKVLALMMPEGESEDCSLKLAEDLVDQYKVEALVESITPLLLAADCYGRRNRAIREILPDFQDEDLCKIVMSSPLHGSSLHSFYLVVAKDQGIPERYRLDRDQYLAIISASNFKQRSRKMLEYYHADRLHYAVCGTPNRLEYDQGFFVKNGDGAADFKPIAHLYKSQVYALGEYLGLPRHILERQPTTDTFSLPQSQDEFYFSLPYPQMDLCLYAVNHGLPLDALAEAAGLTLEQAYLVEKDIASKRRTTQYLHRQPLTFESDTEPFNLPIG